MRVLIDLRWMIPGYTGGIERMACSFLQTLSRKEFTQQFRVLLPRQALKCIKHLHGKQISYYSSNGITYYVDRLGRHFYALISRKKGTLSTSTIVQWIKSQSDVGLSLSGYIHPDIVDLNHVVVVSDIQHEFLPEFFTSNELSRRKEAFTNSIKSAGVVCAVSKFTRDTLIERLEVPPDKVRVIYEAADPIFFTQQNPDNVKKILRRYNLPKGEYLYYPANTWYHKNHILLLKAMKNLGRKMGSIPMLVCTGTPKEAHNEILETVNNLKLEKHFKFLGHCPFEELPAIYKGAAALVFPSLYEGFGLPILEAMAVGCPVACSNVTSLPEIAGDAALYFDPRSVEEMTAAIEKIILESENRIKLVACGLKNIEQFSWYRFVSQVLSAIECYMLAA